MKKASSLVISLLGALSMGLVPCAIVSCSDGARQNVITPAPASVEYTGGFCKTDSYEEILLHPSQDAALADGEAESCDMALLPEGYRLRIVPEGVVASASTSAGLFYARQSYDQLAAAYGRRIPCMEICDAPRFRYRGVMLDVSRHFFDKDFVKKQLRLWAALKINVFHWHLTDGIGWRLPIEGYPALTAGVEHYSIEDVREVIALADSLHITVIPEIEMFGHSEEVWRVYPQFFCSNAGGKTSEYCIGKEATFAFLEEVLSQVMDIFPSEYIHIGGDEAYKGHWAKCPDCRRRMRENGLASVDELQSYGIKRIAGFVHSRGRKIIGWDEILEGGLAPGAAVMSWRGTQGGIEAAASGHGVVMTPGRYCYVNNCQDDPTSEPASQGGYLPLSRVYGYDPAEGVADSQYVMGVQANLWTEYVETPEHMEYMLYPRVFAIAEIGWTMPCNKDYGNFRDRALALVDSVREAGYNTFDLANEKGEREAPPSLSNSLSLGRPVIYNTKYSDKYDGGGDSALTDGRYGSWEFGIGWQGFIGENADVTVDLGQVREISSVTADFGQWATVEIWMPESVTVLFSEDGVHFTPGCGSCSGACGDASCKCSCCRSAGCGTSSCVCWNTIVSDTDPQQRIPVFCEFKWDLRSGVSCCRECSGGSSSEAGCSSCAACDSDTACASCSGCSSCVARDSDSGCSSCADCAAPAPVKARYVRIIGKIRPDCIGGWLFIDEISID